MTRRNRVDPWGDLHAATGRGLFTGNRGCVVDDAGRVVRHHRSSTLWITCQLAFKGWRHPLDAPRVWTPLFFLDDAVALAAGHRPCATCRRDDYVAYRDGVDAGRGQRSKAVELDRRLAGERLRRGRGLSRAADRPLWDADLGDLPIGTVVVIESTPHLVGSQGVHAFSFDGWRPAVERRSATVPVLTPPTSVTALAGGFLPTLHPSAIRSPHR